MTRMAKNLRLYNCRIWYRGSRRKTGTGEDNNFMTGKYVDAVYKIPYIFWYQSLGSDWMDRILEYLGEVDDNHGPNSFFCNGQGFENDIFKVCLLGKR